MKNYITVLFVCLLQSVFAQTTYYVAAKENNWSNRIGSALKYFQHESSYSGALHYVSTSGSDATGDGTIGNPWFTPTYAATQVTTFGDTIFIGNGTFTITSPIRLAPGVSLKGAGTSNTHIISDYVGSWNEENPADGAISLVSTADGTNGSQSISDFLLDGNNLSSQLGILLRCRSNVRIHDITIKDFFVNGIALQGSSVNIYTQPTVYSSNNEIDHIVIDNCTDSDATWNGGGLIDIIGQKDLRIHDFNLSDTSRPAGSNGDLILNNKFSRGTKIYNGNCYKPSGGNQGWNFVMEIPWGEGGTEIYGVNFYGGDQTIDIGSFGGYDEATYDSSFSIHDNYIFDPNPNNEGAHGKCSMSIEGELAKNIYIFRNTFLDVARPISLTDGTTPGVASHDTNIVFTNNVCKNMGMTDVPTWQELMSINKAEVGGSVYGVYIINNTIIPNPTVYATFMSITNGTNCTMKNIVIANNIMDNGNNGYWMFVTNNGTYIDSLIVRNNILYNNPNNNAISFSGNAVTNYINEGNINSDPLFVSATDLSLQATSPAIGAAYNYGYGTDIGAIPYDGSLSVTGFNYDVIVDNVLNGTVSNLRNHDMDGWGYSFYVSGFSSGSTPSQNGLPADGKIVSRTGTTYHFQPWNQNNALWLNSGDSGTITLTSPYKFEKIKIALTNANGPSTVTYKVNYSDGSSDNGNFNINDWACYSCTDYAINQLSRVDGSGTLQNPVFAIYEDSIMTNASKTINSIQFIASGGTLSIFALSAGAIPYTGSLSVTGFNYDVIVDNVLNGTVSNLRNHDMDGWGYSFYVSGFSSGSTPSQNGLPVDGKIVSRTGTTYQFQPWNQNNALWLNSGDSGTITLTSPHKCEKIKIALTNANGSSTVTYKVHYSDGSSDNGNFNINDWACNSCTDYAINQLGRVDGSGTIQNPVFAIYEDSIITNASKTINSIDFTPSGGTLSIFALSAEQVADTNVHQLRTYQLKSVERDGRSNYVPNAENVQINPNPFSQKIYLKIESPIQDKAIVVITDLSGRELYKENISIGIGNNSYQINNAAGFSNGIYFISVFSTAQKKTIKVIKSEAGN